MDNTDCGENKQHDLDVGEEEEARESEQEKRARSREQFIGLGRGGRRSDMLELRPGSRALALQMH